jgi:hypothetical protein
MIPVLLSGLKITIDIGGMAPAKMLPGLIPFSIDHNEVIAAC